MIWWLRSIWTVGQVWLVRGHRYVRRHKLIPSTPPGKRRARRSLTLHKKARFVNIPLSGSQSVTSKPCLLYLIGWEVVQCHGWWCRFLSHPNLINLIIGVWIRVVYGVMLWPLTPVFHTTGNGTSAGLKCRIKCPAISTTAARDR